MFFEFTYTVEQYLTTFYYYFKMFDCERCGHVSSRKGDLMKHLEKMIPCSPTKSDITREDIIKKIKKVKVNTDNGYECIHCNKLFHDKSNMYRHKKICKKKPNDNVIVNNNSDELKCLQEQVNTLILEVQKLKDINNTLQLELKKENDGKLNMFEEALLYVPKDEGFFQRILEAFLKGSHRKLECGITDVTTETCHAECKNWNSYKEGVGQLLIYNDEDPKLELHLYFFGRVGKKLRRLAKQKCINMKIKPYEFLYDNEYVKIIDMVQNKLMFQYRCVNKYIPYGGHSS